MQNTDLKQLAELSVYSRKRLVNPRYQFFTALAMLAAVLAGVLLPPRLHWIPVTAMLVGSAGLLLRFRNRAVFIGLLTLLSVGMLFYSSAVSRPVLSETAESTELYSGVAIEDSLVQASGKTTVTLRQVFNSQSGEPVSHHIQLYISGKNAPAIQCGDEVFFSAVLREVQPPQNPGETDWRLIRLANGIAFTANTRAESVWVGNRCSDLFTVFSDLRRGMIQNTEMALPEADAAIVNGVMLGAEEKADEDFLETMRRLGIVHVFSVSGLHVSLIALALNFLLEKCSVGNRVRLLIGTLLIASYVLLAGASVSAIRAGVMAASLLLCRVLIQPYDSLNALSFAAILLMLLNPLQVFTLGFQLSFSACLGIIFFVRLFQHGEGIWKKLLSAVGVTVSAQVGTLPITANAYGYLAPLSIPANVVIVPVFVSVLFIGLPANLLALLIPPARYLITALYPLTWVIRFLTGLFRQAPVIWICAFSFGATVLYYALLFWSSRFTVAKLKTKLIGALCAVLVFTAALGTQTILQRGYVRLVLLSTGNAMCAVAEIPDYGCCLFDTGGSSEFSPYVSDSAQSRVLPYLRSRGIGYVKSVFLSHGDADHSGGLEAFWGRLQIQTVFYQSLTVPQEKVLRQLAQWQGGGTELQELFAGDLVRLGDARVQVLYPFFDTEERENTSVVYRFSFGGVTVLFPGDLEQADSAKLVQSGDVRCDVMVAPHHGSSATFSRVLLDRADAQLYLISSGSETNREYEDYPVLNTESSGAIEIRIYPTGQFSVKEFRG